MWASVRLSQEPGCSPSVWGREESADGPASPSAWAAGKWLGGSVYTTSSSRMDAGTGRDGLASEHPVPAPSPSSSLQPPCKTVRPPSTAPSIRWKGEEGDGALGFPARLRAAQQVSLPEPATRVSLVLL